MHPVLRSLTDEGGLRTACRIITSDGISSSADQVPEIRQFDDERLGVVLEERFLLQRRSELRPQPIWLHFIMFLNNLVEARVIETRELVQVMNIGDDIAKLVF